MFSNNRTKDIIGILFLILAILIANSIFALAGPENADCAFTGSTNNGAAEATEVIGATGAAVAIEATRAIRATRATRATRAARAVRAEYYDFVINASTTEQTTDGKKPVKYPIFITNTGTHEDTYSIYAEIINVTNCPEPDTEQWTAILDPASVSVAPSQTATINLIVVSGCGCQVHCMAAIRVNCISGGDPAVNKSIITYTTRGMPTEPSIGVSLAVDYNPYLDILILDTYKYLDVEVWNTQLEQESFIAWVSSAPANWSVTISPTEFELGHNSKRKLTLGILVPRFIPSGNYTITVSAKSQNFDEVTGRDSIIIPIIPDLIIEDIQIPAQPLHAGEKVRLNVVLKNIGLANASLVPIVLYDEMNYTTAHELGRVVVQNIEPNQTKPVKLTWRPREGTFNLTARIDPGSAPYELRVDNNIRIRAVQVLEAEEKDNGVEDYYLVYALIVILIMIWLIVYYRWRVGKVKR